MYNKAHQFQRQKLEGQGHHAINVEIKVVRVISSELEGLRTSNIDTKILPLSHPTNPVGET